MYEHVVTVIILVKVLLDYSIVSFYDGCSIDL